MIRFWGKVVGRRSEAVRSGHNTIKAAAMSHRGSVITELSFNEKDELMIEIRTAEEKTSFGSLKFFGTFEEFVNKLKD